MSSEWKVFSLRGSVIVLVIIICRVEVGADFNFVSYTGPTVYAVDDSLGIGRRFDGIGAISGGGATSKLLMNYPAEQVNQILDYLFKPQFAASLQILKVEIGGDSQSTDGVESSHMHTEEDLNLNRGYEWWIMKEAKKRNPAIKLYGLPWVFPGWLGKTNPYGDRSKLVEYIISWIKGARDQYNLTIDYIGIWNERPYDVEYIKMLRNALNVRGFSSVQIVAADGGWNIVKDLLQDPELRQAVGIVGAHYPGSFSPVDALSLDRPLWASEEYSARNDIFGGGCWARVLNEGYVNGYLSGTIAWNLITSYYNHLPYSLSSLMTANEPWSGHYEVNTPIWMTAHHTQFVDIGWHYLLHDFGVGNLSSNGSYVALASPDKKQLTIIIETMNPQKVGCFYAMPKYTVADQKATFVLRGSFARLTKLNVWYSRLMFNGSDSEVFIKQQPINIHDGAFSLYLEPNVVYTLSTLDRAQKGSYPMPPSSESFPLPYADNFDTYKESSEPFNFAQQAGAFEVYDSKDPMHKGVMKQMVPQPPIDTCRPQPMPGPINLIGDFNWSDIAVRVDVYLPSPTEGSTGAFLAGRVGTGGCYAMYSSGLYFWIFPGIKTVMLTGYYNKSDMLNKTQMDLSFGTWYTMELQVQGNTVTTWLDQRLVFHQVLSHVPSVNGFVALGTDNFAMGWFDNFMMEKPGDSTLRFKTKYKSALHHKMKKENQLL